MALIRFLIVQQKISSIAIYSKNTNITFYSKKLVRKLVDIVYFMVKILIMKINLILNFIFLQKKNELNLIYRFLFFVFV